MALCSPSLEKLECFLYYVTYSLNMNFNIKLLSMFAQIRWSIPVRFFGKCGYAFLSSTALGQYLARPTHKAFRTK